MLEYSPLLPNTAKEMVQQLVFRIGEITLAPKNTVYADLHIRQYTSRMSNHLKEDVKEQRRKSFDLDYLESMKRAKLNPFRMWVWYFIVRACGGAVFQWRSTPNI